jgi:hypothetical protein
VLDSVHKDVVDSIVIRSIKIAQIAGGSSDSESDLTHISIIDEAPLRIADMKKSACIVQSV